MADFTLFVSSNPFTSEGHWQALAFSEAAINSGHQISRVFFYSDAVLCASRLINPPQGQESIGKAWSDWAAKSNLTLSACIANSLRRGISDPAERARYQLDADNLLSGFQLAGLGEMAEAASDSSRIIQF